MPCDTRLLPQQTITQRKAEVKDAITRLEEQLARGTVKVKVGPQGAITFAGWDGGSRNRVTDACAYRRLLAGNSAVLRREIARAEATAGRKVDPRAIAMGEHSHDGGKTWGSHE